MTHPQSPIRATIAHYPLDQAQQAAAHADELGGRVVDVPRDPLGLGGGYLAVVHDDAEGLAVSRWNGLGCPGAVLVRRGDLRVGDTVWSSHHGRRAVAQVSTLGSEGPGTTYLLLEGTRSPEAYPADSLIPRLPTTTTTASALREALATAIYRDGEDPGWLRTADSTPNAASYDLADRALTALAPLILDALDQATRRVMSVRLAEASEADTAAAGTASGIRLALRDLLAPHQSPGTVS